LWTKRSEKTVTPKPQKRKNYLKKREKERTSFCEQKEAKKL
jgi:hypothetical protein